jgi:hypothetical protein
MLFSSTRSNRQSNNPILSRLRTISLRSGRGGIGRLLKICLALTQGFRFEGIIDLTGTLKRGGCPMGRSWGTQGQKAAENSESL